MLAVMDLMTLPWNLSNNSANVNMKTFKGEVILGVAIGKNKVDMTKKLLEFGANPNNHHDGFTLLGMAVMKGNVKIVKSLLKYGAKVSQIPLLWPIVCKNSEILQIMLDHGAELKDFDGLQYIVIHGHLEFLKVLIKHGVDVNRYTHMHRVPLHDAITATALTKNAINRIEIVSELLKNGANPNLPHRHSGFTAIHSATKFPSHLKVFLNLEVSLDLNKRNNNGETAFERALNYGRKDTAKMLFHHNHN